MSTSQITIELELREVILQFSPIDSDELTNDTQLLDQQIVDSLGVQALLAFTEARLARRLTEAETVRSNFASITRIAAFVRAEMKAAD